MRSSPRAGAAALAGLLAAGVAWLLAISLSGQAAVLTLLSREGRRALPLSTAGDQEFVSLDDLATALQLAVREDAGTISVSYKGRTILVTPDQALASIGGRLISLPARPVKSNNRWLVPVEFVSRALALIYDTRLDLRRPSRLLIVGDLTMPRITIRHEPLGSAARVTIDATPATPSSVSQDGTHLTIRFEADALDVALPVIQSQGFVQAVRLADTSALAIDLGPRFASYRSSTETIDTTTRLVIDIVGPAEAAPATPVAELPELRPPATPIRTIVLDPGHGGKDTGTKGPGGVVEKDLTLAVARRVKAAIEAQLGMRVILTRDDDREMSLDDRAAIANNNKANLIISLHANAAPRPEVAGATILVASFDEADLAKAVVPPERVGVIGGGTRDLALVPWTVAQGRFLHDSETFAQMLAERLVGPLPAATISKGPLRVLASANMPAIVVELGFLSNAAQEKLLASNEFQGGFAAAVVDTVTKFRDSLMAAGGAGGQP